VFKSINKQSLGIFKIPEFRNFVMGRFFLTLAVQMQMTTIGLQAYYEHGKELMVLGLVSLCEVIPFVISCFYAGYVADVYNRRKIIIVSNFALLLGSVLLFLFCLPSFNFLDAFSYYPLMFVVVLFGIIRAFLAAAMSPFMSQIVPRNQYTQAATWNSTFWHIGAILGPVIAAWIYSYNNTYNAKTTYLINCGLFAIGLVAFARIGNRPQERSKEESVVESLKAGLKFVFKTKMLLSALSLDMFAVLFGGAVAILQVFNDQVLHADPSSFGLLRTAPAVGAVVSAFIMAACPPEKKAGKVLLWGVFAFGVFTIAFAFSTNFWLAFFMLFMTGAVDNISVVVRHSILQLMTPDNMRGRVSAVNSIFIGSSNELGGFESALAGKLMGLVPSIAFGGVMTILVVSAVDRLNPKLRKLNIKDYQ
jgi:MFS family permease